jgi:hypothetical protein
MVHLTSVSRIVRGPLLRRTFCSQAECVLAVGDDRLAGDPLGVVPGEHEDAAGGQHDVRVVGVLTGVPPVVPLAIVVIFMSAPSFCFSSFAG